MDVVRNINVDFTIMKEPRGLMRLIQFVLSIFAFATICSSATANIKVNCANPVQINSTMMTTSSYTLPVKYSYPFNLDNVVVLAPFCSDGQGEEMPFSSLSFAPAAQFFCFVGVMSFLFCIAYCIGYIVFSPVFVNDSRAATIDFVFSAVWTIMWFIASTAWADRLNSMGTYLSPSQLISDLDGELYCSAPGVAKTGGCTAGEAGSHATLIVSVLFGFLNTIVWGAGLWFLYKETSWHKESAGDAERFDQPHGADPSAGTGGESGYQAQSDPNVTPTY